MMTSIKLTSDIVILCKVFVRPYVPRGTKRIDDDARFCKEVMSGVASGVL